jgi:hypothetical protein
MRNVSGTTFLLQYGNIMVGVLYSPPGCDREGIFATDAGFRGIGFLERAQ